MATFPGWQQAILNALHAPASANNVRFLQAWAQAEGGGARYNPFNTTQGAPGAGSYNSVGVRNYTSPQEGVQATIQTLLNGRYGNIVNELRSGQASPTQLASAVAQSPWGTGSGVLRVLGAKGVPVPQSTPSGYTGSSGYAGSAGSGTQPHLNQLIAESMLNQAGNTVMGKAPDPGSLLQLAMLRQQMSAANQLPQAMQPSKAPTLHGGWAGQSLDGQLQMLLGGKSPYSNLKFNSNVDWQHVNPRLLRSINQVAAQHNMVVDINSGYRSNDYSHQVGGFAGDPHTKGLAVDAYVNGKPIGSIFGPNVWGNLGIQSGAVPNFYHGQSDPEHLQL